MKISYEKNCSGALVWQVATTITANDKKMVKENMQQQKNNIITIIK